MSENSPVLCKYCDPICKNNSLGQFYYKELTGYLTFETINHGTHDLFRGCYDYSWNDCRVQTKYSIQTKQTDLSRAALDKNPNSNENLHLASTKTDSLIGLSSPLSGTEISDLEIRVHCGFYVWHSISNSNLLIRPYGFESHTGMKITQDHWGSQLWLLHLGGQNHASCVQECR